MSIGMLALMLAAAFAWGCIPDESRPVLRGKADLVIAFTIWLAAVLLWMSLPLPRNNYFAPPVQAPNFEIYPFSDAEQYDLNSLYVYFGSLKDFVVSKPLYVTILALFHDGNGYHYDRMILLQTLLVAFFPVTLYFIGKELHSRFGGIAIALFAIMREVTAIQATNMANISNTKLLLSDMFAALLASLLVLVLIRWFKSRRNQCKRLRVYCWRLDWRLHSHPNPNYGFSAFYICAGSGPLFSKFEIHCAIRFNFSDSP